MGAPESIVFNSLNGLVSPPLAIALQEGLFPLHADEKSEWDEFKMSPGPRTNTGIGLYVVVPKEGSGCCLISTECGKKTKTKHVFRRYFPPWSWGSEAALPAYLPHFLIHRGPLSYPVPSQYVPPIVLKTLGLSKEEAGTDGLLFWWAYPCPKYCSPR